MGDLAPNEEKQDNIIPLGEGYGTDPYNEQAVMIAISVIKEACEAKGHRCLIVVEPDDSPFFVGFHGKPQWLHWIGGRVMRLAMDEHAESFDVSEFEWDADEGES